jgi:dihydroorotate dehydrogenase (NAD+) catalytic subunit
MPSACKMSAWKTLSRKLPALARYPRCKVIVNVFGYTVKPSMSRSSSGSTRPKGIAAYELNVSCPNVHAGGMAFGSDPGSLEYLVSRANAASRPADRQALAQRNLHRRHGQIAENAGAQTLQSHQHISGHVDRCRNAPPRLTNVTGGLSGPAIKPIALRMVYEAAQAVKIPILGMGGIVTPEDAIEFLLPARRPSRWARPATPIRELPSAWRAASSPGAAATRLKK